MSTEGLNINVEHGGRIKFLDRSLKCVHSNTV